MGGAAAFADFLPRLAAGAAGEAICGSALDWRKAFDHVSLQLVERVLRRAGVTTWLPGPLLAAYMAEERSAERKNDDGGTTVATIVEADLERTGSL